MPATTAPRSGARLLRLLAKVYASEPPGSAVVPTAQDGLLTALSELVAELRAARQEQRAWERGLTRAVQAALAVREGAPSS